MKTLKRKRSQPIPPPNGSAAEPARRQKSAPSPDKPPLSWRKKVLIALAYLAWTAIGFTLASLVFGAIFALLVHFVPSVAAFADSRQAVANTLLTGLIFAAALLLVIGLPKLIFKQHTTRRELGVQKALSWRDLLLSPVAYIVYMIFSVLLGYVAMTLIPAFDIREAQNVGFENLTSNLDLLVAFIALVVMAPIAEELLFRGYLFAKLRRFLSFWTTALLVSLLFGALHGQWNVGLDTFVMSMVLVFVREKTGTVWVPILVHMIKNGIAYFILFVAPLMGLGITG